MSIPEDPDEPLQKLPAGMPRRYAEYKPVTSDAVVPPPTSVGGYSELLSYFQERGQALPRKAESLATLDQAINDGLPAELARPVGMFYGDLLTHTVPGAHWEVVEEGYPLVRITRKTAVDVVRVALGHLATPFPTLEQNYAHVLELVRQEP
ncbi:DUF6278 family protein [Arthrobacter globiformis]|uniref:DUF3806 domain-containing protein n=1 Tax=Arthrobacter globiformis TaxID=1665 RepID=A0A328HEY0_ARTGO|nr:DUF6278 family protein [Arthrobacter globiformis]RAM37218.1 hypothetical protein DBZ45_11295 [Arthrobacter globiformis]